MKQEYEIQSKADGLNISVLEMRPEKTPKAVIQLVHGMSEHKERYIPFMEYLLENGFASVIHDHRGHGKSVKSKEDLGYMYGGGADALLEDIHGINQRIHEQYPNIPVVLFGHSMGSLAVRAYAAVHDQDMDCLIVCGSPSKNPARPIGAALAHIEKKIRGEKHRSRMIEKMSLGSYMKNFKDEKDKNGWICSDPEVVRAYTASDYCGFTFTDEAYLVLFELMKRAYSVRSWKCTAKELPILFISGAKDPCMGNVRGFAHAVQNMRKIGYLNVRGKLYPDMRHEILNEIGKEIVFQDVCTYINKCLK